MGIKVAVLVAYLLIGIFVISARLYNVKTGRRTGLTSAWSGLPILPQIAVHVSVMVTVGAVLVSELGLVTEDAVLYSAGLALLSIVWMAMVRSKYNRAE